VANDSSVPPSMLLMWPSSTRSAFCNAQLRRFNARAQHWQTSARRCSPPARSSTLIGRDRERHLQRAMCGLVPHDLVGLIRYLRAPTAQETK
jgi:hypothetical protein